MGASGKTFLKNCKIGAEMAYVSSSANISGTVVDTAGYTGVVFIATLHNQSATASCVFKVQGAATSASCAAGTSVDLSGTAIDIVSSSGNGRMFISEIHKPTQRYLRLYATRGGSGSAVSAKYILYGPTGAASQPVPLDNAVDDVVIVEQHISPAVGTA